MIHRRLNLRAGMVLVPVGIINERHEPPTFQGVERTFVDTVIVPTTWRDTGVGRSAILGAGFRIGPMCSPASTPPSFSATRALPEGRQQGFQADASDPAITGRLEYRRGGLTAGAQLLARRQRLWPDSPRHRDPDGWRVVARCALSPRPHELRGQWSMVNIGGAGDLNRALQSQSGNSPNIASRLMGAYGEAATRVSARLAGRTKSWRSADTSCSIRRTRCRTGYLPLQEFQRSAWSPVATYYPIPMSRSSSMWSRTQQEQRRQRTVADQSRRGLVVLVMREVNVSGIVFVLRLALRRRR